MRMRWQSRKRLIDKTQSFYVKIKTLKNSMDVLKYGMGRDGQNICFCPFLHTVPVKWHSKTQTHTKRIMYTERLR